MTTNTVRAVLLAGAATLLALGGCGQNDPAATATAAEAEESANERFDRLLEEQTVKVLRADPRLATSLNVSEEAAGGRYKDRFSTPGIAGVEETRARNAAFIKALRATDGDALSAERQSYRAILLAGRQDDEALEAIAQDLGAYFAGGFNSPYIVSQIGGIQGSLPQFMTQTHPLQSVDDAEAYIARLNQFEAQFEGTVELINANAEAGILPPEFSVQGAINNASRFINGPASDNVLYTHFRDTVNELGFAEAEELSEQALNAVENSVYPAYEALIASLRGHLSDTTPDAGIWDVPQGDDIYNALIGVNGESMLTGDGIHQLGLSEVARIEAELAPLFAEIGMTEGSVGERLAMLTADPEQIFPDTDEGREELLAYIRGLAAEAETVMEEYFLATPSIGFEIRRIPVYREQGAAGGYYISPAEDGSRPGIFEINLRTTAAHPRYQLPTLTYHEGVPGHHFQLALRVDAKDTPLLVRQNASSGGMVEGWALYSEKFAEEIGLYSDDPYGNIGRLQAELFRAVRLVVDSGMHAKRWTREEAIEYMIDTTGSERSDVESEIERYAVWPGQALSYKIGMLKIQDLRQRAELALGDDFDVRVFHYEILRGGGAPLDLLEKRIDDWIEAGGPAPDLG